MKPTHNTSHRDRRHFSNRIGGSISALVLAAITAGSAHAVDIDYSIEDFSAGTPNYTINGVNNSVTSDSWDPLQFPPVDITPFDAVAGTGYDVTSTTRNGVVANGEPTHFVPGGTIPTGQHGCVSTSSNRDFTSNYPLTLVSNSEASLDITLSSMFFALSTDGNPVTAKGSAVVLYSALGDFTDAVQLVSFGIGQTGSWVVTPDFPMVEHTWDTTISVTITDGMSANSFTSQALGYTTPSTVVFTDTAKIRINRAPLVGLVAPDTTTNHVTFLDDITVTGVPGPAVTYATWSGGAAADIDTNGDSVKNAVAYALGAADVSENAIPLLPTSVDDGTYLVFTFDRSDEAEADGTTAISVEYGSDLTGWTTAVDDATNVIITETGSAPTNVEVKLLKSSLGAAGKLFARLKVVVTP